MQEPQRFHPVHPISMGTKYTAMTRKRKLIFVAQLIVCIGTFGFAFPNVQSS